MGRFFGALRVRALGGRALEFRGSAVLGFGFLGFGVLNFRGGFGLSDFRPWVSASRVSRGGWGLQSLAGAFVPELKAQTLNPQTPKP